MLVGDGVGGGSCGRHAAVAKPRPLPPALGEHVLDELEGDAAEPIPVGNHNLLDSAADRAVQKGEQAPAVEVDAGRNVLNDFVLGIAGAEVEVCALLGARDAAVENASSRLCCRILRGGGGHVQGPLDVGQAVQPLAGGGGPDPDAHRTRPVLAQLRSVASHTRNLVWISFPDT